MKKRVIGIDFGSSNTLIWRLDSNQVVFNEPTILARDKETGEVLEIGYLAHKLIGKAPSSVELVRPVQNGVIADKKAAYDFLRGALRSIKLESYFKKSAVIFAVPDSITPVEKEALFDVTVGLKAKEFFTCDSSLASALGSGIEIYSTRGNMIVDIGGAKTKVATLTMGKLVATKAFTYAGDFCDEAITRYIRTKHHLVIGPKNAEYIKMKIGTLLESFDNNLLEINGKDVITGLPHSIIISTAEIQEVLVKVYNEISNLIIDTLEVSPPEISADIIHTGITISGGGCMLNGTREYFQSKLSVPIHISPYPLEACIYGIKEGYEGVINTGKIAKNI